MSSEFNHDSNSSSISRLAIDNWENEDVSEYYENIPVSVMKDFSTKGGLEACLDIDIAYPYIKNSSNLIEVGAAYGRVITRLIQKGFKGKIFAVERSTQYYNFLLRNFSKEVELIHADLQQLNFSEQFDSLLWMWSNISEFPKDKQMLTLKHLASWLKKDGIFVMETISHTLIPTNVSITHKQSYVVNSEYGMAYGYTPSTEEVHEYAAEAGFKNIKHFNYKTTTGRDRVVHILRNKCL